MWVDSYDKDLNSCMEYIKEVRKKWLVKDPKNEELAKKVEKQIICYGYKPIREPMINLKPCEICGTDESRGTCFTEGERFSGACFGDNLAWCNNCGQCNHTKWDEY